MMMESPKKKNKDDSIDSPALPPGVSGHFLLRFVLFPITKPQKNNLTNSCTFLAYTDKKIEDNQNIPK